MPEIEPNSNVVSGEVVSEKVGFDKLPKEIQIKIWECFCMIPWTQTFTLVGRLGLQAYRYRLYQDKPCKFYDAYTNGPPTALVSYLSRQVALSYYRLVRVPNFMFINPGYGIYLNRFAQDRIYIDTTRLPPCEGPEFIPESSADEDVFTKGAMDRIERLEQMVCRLHPEEGNFVQGLLYFDKKTMEARGAYYSFRWKFPYPFYFPERRKTEVVPLDCEWNECTNIRSYYVIGKQKPQKLAKREDEEELKIWLAVDGSAPYDTGVIDRVETVLRNHL